MKCTETNAYVTQRGNLLSWPVKNVLGRCIFHLLVPLAGESKSSFWTLVMVFSGGLANLHSVKPALGRRGEKGSVLKNSRTSKAVLLHQYVFNILFMKQFQGCT